MSAGTAAIVGLAEADDTAPDLDLSTLGPIEQLDIGQAVVDRDTVGPSTPRTGRSPHLLTVTRTRHGPQRGATAWPAARVSNAANGLF